MLDLDKYSFTHKCTTFHAVKSYIRYVVVYYDFLMSRSLIGKNLGLVFCGALSMLKECIGKYRTHVVDVSLLCKSKEALSKVFIFQIILSLSLDLSSRFN